MANPVTPINAAAHAAPEERVYLVRHAHQATPALDLWDFALLLARHKRLVLGLCAAGGIIAAAASWTLQPIYRAEVTTMAVQEEQLGGDYAALGAQFAGLASLAGLDAGVGPNHAEALATLSSRAFINTFIEQQQLLTVLFEQPTDAIALPWRKPASPADAADAWELFSEEVLHIREVPDTGVVVVAIEWHNPVLAASWANLLVQQLNQSMRSEAIAQAQTSIDFLNQELAKTSVVELRQAIYRLIEAQIQKSMLARGRPEYSLKIIDPAQPPQADKFIRPRRLVMTAGGVIAGLLAAIAAISLRAAHRAKTSPE